MLITGVAQFFPIPEDCVNGYSRIGVNDPIVDRYDPMDRLKMSIFSVALTRELGTSIDLSHRHTAFVGCCDNGQRHSCRDISF